VISSLAKVVLHEVGIVFLGGNTTVVDDPLVGTACKASAAAEVASGTAKAKAPGAVNELLFGEGNELFVLEVKNTFKTSGGTKSPARSTDSLILDGRDGSDGCPVDVRREVVELGLGGDGVKGRGSVLFGSDDLWEDKLSELLVCHVSKVIHRQLVGVILAVVRVDVILE